MTQGYRSVWPSYKAEKGDVLGVPHDLGFKGNGAVGVKTARVATAHAIGDANRQSKVVDRGGKPPVVKELDSLFVQLKAMQAGAKCQLMAGRVKSALVDLARTRAKLATMATTGTKPVVSFEAGKILPASTLAKTSQDSMAVITRKEVALFRARWSSLLG